MTDEQSLLRDSVKQFCTAPDTIAAIQADTMQGGFPRRSWDKLAEAGFIGMSIPEEYGGQG